MGTHSRKYQFPVCSKLHPNNRMGTVLRSESWGPCPKGTFLLLLLILTLLVLHPKRAFWTLGLRMVCTYLLEKVLLGNGWLPGFKR